MQNKLLFSFLVALFGLFFAGPAAASHMQGGDLSYASLGNNRYLVTLHVYRDCSGISLSSFALECRAGGCNTAAAFTTNMQQVGPAVVARQYCATLTGVCNGTVTNTEAYTFTATVTLPPAATWVLSCYQSARPTTANLASPGDLYFEATLNNLVPVAGTTGQVIANSSPVASVQPAFFVPVHQYTTLSNNGFDADGDSLVYSLEAPLQACGSAATFASYPNSGQLQTLSTSPPCYLQMPTISAYSAALPIYVDVDTLGQCPLKTGANPRFNFDARTGAIGLQPGRYLNTPTTSGDNKYAAVVKISEYRRLNGRYVLVGTMRRDLYFMVYDCGTNLMPRIAPTLTRQSGTTSTTQSTSQVISVMAGSPVSVLVTATDRNAGQAVSFNLDYNAVPATSLQNLGNGQARLTFTPPATMAPGLYRVAVTAEDDACPIKGIDTQPLTFRVMGTALATHAGGARASAPYPNPFSDVVQFQLAAPGVQALTVSDYLGRTVTTLRSQADGTVRWQPAAELPAGLYLARPADGSPAVRLLRSVGR